jgi:hypothetical protein
VQPWTQLDKLDIEGAEIAENKTKWYLTVITIDYMDLNKKKKIGVLHLNLRVLKTLLHPLAYA